MPNRRSLRALVAPAVVLSVAVVAIGAEGSLRARLSGSKEVPALSTTGSGTFVATISEDGSTLTFELSYADLQGVTTAAHIHLAQPDVNGGIAAFLCGGGTKPACPASPATVTGTVVASDVIGPAGQGIAAGEFAELLQAIGRGNTYVNVHSDLFPGGEIRGQIQAED